MSALASIENPPTLTQSQQEALVTLLTDDDPTVFEAVRRRILCEGQRALGWLKPHHLSDDPLLRRRSQSLVQHLEGQQADNDFLSFCLKNSGEKLDLEQGCWKLALTRNPEINTRGYSAMLDDFAGELLDRIDFGAEPEGILAEFNHFLYRDLGFSGTEEGEYDPDTHYLNQAIDRRRGSPVALCLIYLFVARRLRLPVTGIGMPDFFLCRFQTSREEIYINAFNRGQLLTKSACVRYLQQTGHKYNEAFLAPISPRMTLLRLCSDLQQTYANIERIEDQERLQRYIIALSD